MIEREKMVRALEERLKWLEDSDSDKESDMREAAAIKHLLHVMRSSELNLEGEHFSTEKAVNRFWSAYDTRLEVERERGKLLAGSVSVADYLGKETDVGDGTEKVAGVVDAGVDRAAAESIEGRIAGENTGKEDKEAWKSKRKELSKGKNSIGSVFKGIREKGLFVYLAAHRRGAVIATAIVFVAVALAGGAVGAYAEKQMGFLYFLNEDDVGMDMLVVQSSKEKVNEYTYKEWYESLEDLPEEYQNIIRFPREFLEMYNVERICVLDNTDYIFFEIQYNYSSTGEIVECVQKHFKDIGKFHHQAYDLGECIETIMCEDIEIGIYDNDQSDDIEYIAKFYYDDLFYVQGNASLSTIENSVMNLIDLLVLE